MLERKKLKSSNHGIFSEIYIEELKFLIIYFVLNFNLYFIFPIYFLESEDFGGGKNIHSKGLVSTQFGFLKL